jgi:hypothetical protein
MQIVLWAMASFPFLSSWQAGDDFFAQACQTKTQGRHQTLVAVVSNGKVQLG